MGIFNNMQKDASVNVYDKEIKPRLVSDGKIHVIMINSFSKFINQVFGCEDKYTTQIDEILSKMQEDGFTVIDVKFNSIEGQGAFKTMEGFHTLITYK